MAIRTIIIDNQDITLNKKSTNFSSDTSSSVSSLTVDNITGFAVNNILLLGNLKQEKSEIIKTHSSTSPSGSTITLASTTSFAHSRGDKITLLDWDQIEVSWSSTITGSKTVLATIAIQVDQQNTIYNDTVETTGFYFWRYKNSIDSTFSSYSDDIPYAGFADNTVFAIKDRALNDLGYKRDEKITDDFLNKSLWEGRRELDNDEKVLRWSFRQKFDQNIGTLFPGTWKIAVPTDLKDPNTNKNVISVRIGKQNRPLEYQDKVRFNQNYLNIGHTTLNGAITSADTSITLTDSGDFDESGNIYIAGATTQEVNDLVSYTANNEATNVLTGVTGIQSAGHASGTDVWQNISFGFPTFYTVNGGYIYFDIPIEDDLAGENVYMDYWGELVEYDSDADTLDEPEFDMFVSWLKYKIKYRKANGIIDLSKDSDYLEWLKRKNNLINKEILVQNIFLVPDIN